MNNSNILINLLTNDCTGSSSQTFFSLSLHYSITAAHNQEYPNYFDSFHTNYIIFRNVEFIYFYFQITKKIEGKN
jgi:hypothetical protein